MLREPDLTLEKAIQAEQSAEEARSQTELMTKTPETENIDCVVEIAGNLNIQEMRNTRWLTHQSKKTENLTG